MISIWGLGLQEASTSGATENLQTERAKKHAVVFLIFRTVSPVFLNFHIYVNLYHSFIEFPVFHMFHKVSCLQMNRIWKFMNKKNRWWDVMRWCRAMGTPILGNLHGSTRSKPRHTAAPSNEALPTWRRRTAMIVPWKGKFRISSSNIAI